jgi:hypothetical protein
VFIRGRKSNSKEHAFALEKFRCHEEADGRVDKIGAEGDCIGNPREFAQENLFDELAHVEDGN